MDDIVNVLLKSASRIKKLIGNYPPIIYVSDDEYKQILKLKPAYASEWWHITICGAPVRHISEITDD